jgi:DNA-binding HxlR family transcriptional regulator
MGVDVQVTCPVTSLASSEASNGSTIGFSIPIRFAQELAMKVINRLPGLPVERALAVVSGRWKAVILYVLLDGPQRTCELENRIVGISQKVLIEQLRALEEHGMVSRQARAQDSQGIEYRLTALGESLRPVLNSLIEWGIHHATELDEADRILPCEAVVRDRING